MHLGLFRKYMKKAEKSEALRSFKATDGTFFQAFSAFLRMTPEGISLWREERKTISLIILASRSICELSHRGRNPGVRNLEFSICTLAYTFAQNARAKAITSPTTSRFPSLLGVYIFILYQMRLYGD